MPNCVLSSLLSASGLTEVPTEFLLLFWTATNSRIRSRLRFRRLSVSSQATISRYDICFGCRRWGAATNRGDGCRTNELGSTSRVLTREIDLLREYRTRLIADVVTGKLDVREAAARLPDEVEDSEPFGEAEVLAEGEDEPAEDLDTVPDAADA